MAGRAQKLSDFCVLGPWLQAVPIAVPLHYETDFSWIWKVLQETRWDLRPLSQLLVSKQPSGEFTRYLWSRRH